MEDFDRRVRDRLRLQPQRHWIQHHCLTSDHTGLSQLANAVPDRGLGRPDLPGDLVQRLAGILLQLDQDFPVNLIYLNSHSLFPGFVELSLFSLSYTEQMFLSAS